MTINDNLNKLVEKITEITEVKEVVSYFKNLTTTPQAVILYRWSTEDVVSTLNVKQIHNFRIIVRTEFKNTATQELYTRQLTELVLDKLNSNRNLDKSVEFVNIDTVTVDWEESDEKTRAITFDISVQNFNDIN